MGLIRIHVAKDGLVVIGEPIYATVSPHEAWCDSVRDALVDKRWQDVYRMLEKHDEDELAGADDERIDYTFPLVACEDKAQAKQLVIKFCKMGVGSHPLLAPKERWYYIPGFDGTVEALATWARKFEAAL